MGKLVNDVVYLGLYMSSNFYSSNHAIASAPAQGSRSPISEFDAFLQQITKLKTDQQGLLLLLQQIRTDLDRFHDEPNSKTHVKEIEARIKRVQREIKTVNQNIGKERKKVSATIAKVTQESTNLSKKLKLIFDSSYENLVGKNAYELKEILDNFNLLYVNAKEYYRLSAETVTSTSSEALFDSTLMHKIYKFLTKKDTDRVEAENLLFSMLHARMELVGCLLKSLKLSKSKELEYRVLLMKSFDEGLNKISQELNPVASSQKPDEGNGRVESLANLLPKEDHPQKNEPEYYKKVINKLLGVFGERIPENALEQFQERSEQILEIEDTAEYVNVDEAKEDVADLEKLLRDIIVTLEPEVWNQISYSKPRSNTVDDLTESVKGSPAHTGFREKLWHRSKLFFTSSDYRRRLMKNSIQGLVSSVFFPLSWFILFLVKTVTNLILNVLSLIEWVPAFGAMTSNLSKFFSKVKKTDPFDIGSEVVEDSTNNLLEEGEMSLKQSLKTLFVLGGAIGVSALLVTNPIGIAGLGGIAGVVLSGLFGLSIGFFSAGLIIKGGEWFVGASKRFANSVISGIAAKFYPESPDENLAPLKQQAATLESNPDKKNKYNKILEPLLKYLQARIDDLKYKEHIAKDALNEPLQEHVKAERDFLYSFIKNIKVKIENNIDDEELLQILRNFCQEATGRESYEASYVDVNMQTPSVINKKDLVEHKYTKERWQHLFGYNSGYKSRLKTIDKLSRESTRSLDKSVIRQASKETDRVVN